MAAPALQLRTASNLVLVDLIASFGLYRQIAFRHTETYFKTCEQCPALLKEKRKDVCMLMDVKKQTFTCTCGGKKVGAT